MTQQSSIGGIRSRVLVPIAIVLLSFGIAACGSATNDQTVTGVTVPGGQPDAAALYVANCARCHGKQGQGGFGNKLKDNETELTFPNESDEVAWIKQGSKVVKGQPYGDVNRVGGQHVARTGAMPAFGEQVLSDDEVRAIVSYTRKL